MNQVDKTVAEEVPPWGPKMLVLSEKRRKFVCALYDEEAPVKGDGLFIYAASMAGYGTPTSSKKSLSVIANRLVQDDRIREAIAEYSRGLVRAISPEAVRAVRELIRDKGHRDHARALAIVLDRIDPIETTHNVKVSDYRAPSIEVTEKVLARIAELARQAGVPALPPPIDAEFKVVSEEGPS
jgi:nucleotide-binding universal stress UspA family protein